MSDINLDPSITSVTNRAVAVASTASARELLKISRIGPSLEQTENANLEITLNARAEDLASTATANELRNLGSAIGNLLEPQSNELLMDWREGFLPDQRFANGQFLRTAGSHQKSWGGVTTTTLDELELTSVATGESLVYNSTSGKFENSTNTFAITVYAAEADLPASPLTGSLAYVTATSEVYYFDGSLWTIVQDVFSGIYRGNWQSGPQQNFNSSSWDPFNTSGTVLMVDGTEATGGTTAGGSLDTTSRWATNVQNNFNSSSWDPFNTSGTIMMVDGTEATDGTVGGSLDTTSRWATNVQNNFNSSSWDPFNTSGTVTVVDVAQPFHNPSETDTTGSGGGFLYSQLDQGFDFTSNIWTAELWVKPEAGNSNIGHLIGCGDGGAFDANNWVCRISGGVLQVWWAGGMKTGTTAVTPDQWNHVAVVRYGNDLKVYLNGQQELGGFSTGGGNGDSTDNTLFLFGAYFASAEPGAGTYPYTSHGAAGNLFRGKIADVRITNTEVYSGGFSVPSENLEKIAGTKFLTAREDNFIDESDSPHTITQNGNQITSGSTDSPYS